MHKHKVPPCKNNFAEGCRKKEQYFRSFTNEQVVWLAVRLSPSVVPKRWEVKHVVQMGIEAKVLDDGPKLEEQVRHVSRILVARRWDLCLEFVPSTDGDQRAAEDVISAESSKRSATIDIEKQVKKKKAGKE